jgi:D-alanyl-D-alanine carboxypeptidase
MPVIFSDSIRKSTNRKVGLTISLTMILSLLAAGTGASAQVVASEPAFCIAEPCFDVEDYSIDEAASPWVVVNKQRPLEIEKYVPKTLVKPAFASPRTNNPYGLMLSKPAGDAFITLAKALKKAGAGELFMQSAYRSYNYQVSVHSRAVARLGLKAGEALAARPGFSEHQTGLAVDVAAIGQGCVIRVCFSKTRAGRYVAKYGYRFGFIVRYPDGDTATTGYQYEPWHLRYVGVGLATEMHNTGVTVLENFWGLDAAPAY